MINQAYPHLGASPDGIILCDCCGTGCLEIKCPYCARGCLPGDDGAVDYLVMSEDGLKLKQDHAYFYQIQAQMHIYAVAFSDFVVWTRCGMYIERICAANEFFTIAVEKVTTFYKYGVLPELIGKWYTKKGVISGPDETQATSTRPQLVCTPIDEASNSCSPLVICYCKQPENGDMIGCDFLNCSIEWFHQSCLKIKSVPNGKWYCPECRKLFKGRHPPKALLDHNY